MPPTIFPSKLILPKLKVWLSSHDYTHFVTLVFNRQETLDSARDKLKKFHASIDQKILGVDWYKKPPEKRSFFFAFPEHIHSNLHYHLLMRVNDEHIERFEQHAPDVWERLVKGGSIDIQSFAKAPDSSGYVSYCLKEQYQDQNYRSFVISREFTAK